MLKSQLLHPHILAGLARGGHGSLLLIADGNFPHATARGPNAELVFLNLAPGLLNATDVLAAVLSAVPVEAACIMDYARSGPHALKQDPPVWTEFSGLLAGTDCRGDLRRLDRDAFYAAARAPEVCLAIATGEQRLYANLLLTIGVVR